jgi:hypothetical protein
MSSFALRRARTSCKGVNSPEKVCCRQAGKTKFRRFPVPAFPVASTRFSVTGKLPIVVRQEQKSCKALENFPCRCFGIKTGKECAAIRCRRGVSRWIGLRQKPQSFEQHRRAAHHQQPSSNNVLPYARMHVLFEGLLGLARNQKNRVILSLVNQVAVEGVASAEIHGAGAGDVVLALRNNTVFSKPIVARRGVAVELIKLGQRKKAPQEPERFPCTTALPLPQPRLKRRSKIRALEGCGIDSLRYPRDVPSEFRIRRGDSRRPARGRFRAPRRVQRNDFAAADLALVSLFQIEFGALGINPYFVGVIVLRNHFEICLPRSNIQYLGGWSEERHCLGD